MKKLTRYILSRFGGHAATKEEIKEAGQRAEVIRFKNPNKKVKFNDLIRGEIEFDTTGEPDLHPRLEVRVQVIVSVYAGRALAGV